MAPIAAQTPGKNHRPRKKPRRSDPTLSPPSLSDGRLPQKAFQAQSLSCAKTPYPGYLVAHRIGYEERTMDTMGPFPHPPKVKFGKEFDWNADRRAVHLSCILDGGPEHTQPLQIYILEEALMDAWPLTDNSKTD